MAGNMPFMTQVPKGVSANDYRRTGADFVFRKPLCVHISAIKELILPYHDVYVYPEKLLKTPSNHTELADILLSICKNSNLDLQLFHVDSDEDNEEDDLFEKGVKLLERIMNMLRSQRANGLEVVGDGTLEAMRSKYNNMGRAFRASIETFNNMMSDIVSKTNELRLLREYKRKKEGGILKGGIESYSLEASNSIRFCTGDSTDSRNTLTNDVAGEKRDATGSPNITTGSGALSHSEVSGFGKSVGLCGSLSLKEDANEYQPNNNNNNNNTTDIIITEDYLAAIHEPGTFNALGNFNVENMTTSEMSLLIRNFKCRVIDLQNENELLVKDMKRFTDYSVGFENAMTDNNICVKFGTSVLRGSSISLNDDESEGSTTEEGKTSAKIIEGETVSLDNILPIISYIKRDNKNNSSFKHSSGVAHVRGGLYMNYEEYSRRLECSIMAREDTFGKAPLKSLHRDSLNKEKDTVTPISVSFRPISRQTHDNKNPMQKFNDTLYKMCNGVAKDINRAIAKLMATHPIHHLLLENLSQTLRQKLNKFDMDLYISEMDKYVESRVSLETKVLEDDLVRAKQTIKKIREQNVGLDTRKQLMALRQTVFVTQKRVSRILEAKVRQKITIVWYYKWRLAIAVKRKGGRSTISYDVNDTTSKNNAINELRYAKEEIAALTRTIEHGRKLAESKRNSFVKSTPSFDLKKNTSFSKTPRYDTSRVDEDIKTSNVTMNYTTNLDIKKSTAPRSQEDSISTPVSRYDTSRVDEDIKTSNVTMNYTTNLDIKKSTAQRSQEDSINTPVSRYDTSRVDEDIKTSNVTMKYITNLDSVSQDHDDIGNSDNIQSDMSPVKHGSSPTEETLKYETISLESPISDVSADVSKSVTRKAAIRKNDAALLTTNKQKVRNVGGNSASSKNRGNDAVRGKLDGKSLDKGESKQTFTNTKISQNLNPNSSRGSIGGKKVTKKVLSQKESATARDPHANGIIKRNLSSQQGELHSPDDAPQEELEVRPGSGSKEINITASHVTTSSQQFSDSIAGDAVHTICSSTSAIGVNPLIPGDSIEKGTCYQSTDVKGDSNSISLVSLVPMEGAEGQLSQELASNTDSRRDEETLDTTMMSEYSSSLFAVETNRTPLLESMRDYNSQTNITPATLVTVTDNDHVLLTSGNMVGCKTLLSPHAIPSVHVNSESDSIINNATSTADGYDNYLSYDVSVKKEKSCGTVHTSSEKSSSVSPFLSPPRSLRDTNSDSVGNSPTTNQTSPSHQFQPVYPVISPMVAALKSNMFRSSIPNTADDIRQYIGGSRSARGHLTHVVLR